MKCLCLLCSCSRDGKTLISIKERYINLFNIFYQTSPNYKYTIIRKGANNYSYKQVCRQSNVFQALQYQKNLPASMKYWTHHFFIFPDQDHPCKISRYLVFGISLPKCEKFYALENSGWSFHQLIALPLVNKLDIIIRLTDQNHLWIQRLSHQEVEDRATIFQCLTAVVPLPVK